MPTTARLPLAFALFLSITAGCGGGGDGFTKLPDGGFDGGDGAVAMGTGTADDPIVLSAGSRATSPVTTDLTDTAWYVVDLVAPGPYVLLTEDLPETIGLDVHGAPDLASPTLASCAGAQGPLLCTLDLAPGRYYLSAPLAPSAVYHVTYLRLASEGTPTSPRPIVLGASRWASVTTSAPSYYAFTVDVSGAYELGYVPLPGSDLSLSIELFANADFTATPVDECSAAPCDFSGLRAGRYGVRVSGAGTGGVLAIAKLTKALGEGAIGDTVALPLGAYAGSVDSWSVSYYRFTTGPAPAGSYRFTFDAPSAGHVVRLTTADVANGTSVGGCAVESTACEIGGLDSNTTYFVQVASGASESYVLRYAKGSYEGSLHEPVGLPLAIPHDLVLGPDAESFYRFVTTTSGPYELSLLTLSGATGAPALEVFASPDFTTSLGACVSSPCLTTPLDGNRMYYVRVGTHASANVQLTVRRASVGDGSPNDPVAMTLGSTRTTTFAAGGTSYFSYTTGATPPTMIAFFAKDPGGGGGNVRVTPLLTSDCNLPSCIYSNLAPNTKYTFAVGYGATFTADVRLADLAVASGCDSAGLACLDFESGAPVTTAPAYSVDPWSVTSTTAATGTYSFMAGSKATNNEQTCFTYTVPGSSSVAWFSLRQSTNLVGAYSVTTTDGATTSVVATPYASNVWRRGMARAAAATNRGWTFCYQKSASGPQADELWLDDVQFE